MDKFQALNKLSGEVYQNAVDHGFYDAEHKIAEAAGGDIYKHEILQHLVFGQRVALIHSELSEALEADRLNRFSTRVGAAKDALSRNDEAFEDIFRSCIKDTLEDEIADALIRILDLCAANNIDIGTHVWLKMAYNAKRPKMHGKKY